MYNFLSIHLQTHGQIYRYITTLIQWHLHHPPNIPNYSSVPLFYLGLGLYRTIGQNTHSFTLKHTSFAQNLGQY